MRKLNSKILIFIPLSLIIFMLSSCSTKTKTSNVRVFAAASLTECFGEIGKALEKKNLKVEFNFAGSQQLATSLEQGTPAEVLASASIKYMDELQKKKVIDSSIIFAKNKLIICKNKSSNAIITKLSDLGGTGVKLVIADKSVPVGDYFYSSIDKAVKAGKINTRDVEKILSNIKSNELSVKDVVSKVLIGQVDAGVVYKTDITSRNKDKLEVIEPEEFMGNEVSYPIGVLGTCKNKEGAQVFVDYVNSKDGKAILKKYGFVVD
ncbi:MAG: molybdate ABC transporter substrate-binding protein [Clostridiaceae bacterium]|nr:molybdate ABC transporter substrate-binding protein [Clostridiaceae bacterium]